MSARERISQVLELWFLREPLLFAIWTTHHLVVEPRLQTIRVGHGNIEYNPDFINSLDKRMLEQVMRSEATRILLKHPYMRRQENHTLAYLASNITLQELLQTELPFPRARDVFGTEEYNQQYFEFYYNKLREQADQQSAMMFNQTGASSPAMSEGSGDSSQTDGATSPGQGADETADTPPTEETPEPPETETPPSPMEQYSDAAQVGQENTQDWDLDELLEDKINNQIQLAQESQSWGSIAGRLRELIVASLRPKLDYRAVLRQFRASVLAVNRVLTRMKPSRRYGFLYMGSRRDFTTNLLFAVDVSGSIPSDDLQRGFSVINQFFKYGIQSIDVVQFDTEIKGPPMSLKRARREIKVLGRGGTSFNPILDYIDDHRQYDGLIIFTDGQAYVPPKPKNRTTRVLWLFNNEANYQHMAKQLRFIGTMAYLK